MYSRFIKKYILFRIQNYPKKTSVDHHFNGIVYPTTYFHYYHLVVRLNQNMVSASSASLFLIDTDIISSENKDSKNTCEQHQQKPKTKNHLKIIWTSVVLFIILHSLAIYGIFTEITKAKLSTFVFLFVVFVCANIGVTAGAHRLWSHRSYKAKWPLRLLLMLFQTTAFQNDIYDWARNHRVHHKFMDTNADPHSSKRGFFFSHIGWLLVRKHPDVKTKGKTLDISDLEQDAIVMWQHKYYWRIMPFLTFIIPTLIPYLCWNESLRTSFFLTVVRYIASVNFMWLVNSAAHIWGMRPYDKTISPTENLPVTIVTLGEAFHNYHHAFPWDYKAAELGDYVLNLSTAFIDMFAKIGWAYDLKTATKEIITKRARRLGDGSRCARDDEVWGWDDEEMSTEDKSLVKIINRKWKC